MYKLTFIREDDIMRKMKLYLWIGILLAVLCSCSSPVNSEPTVPEAEYKKITDELNSSKTELEKANKDIASLKEESEKLKSDIESKEKEYDKIVEENKMLNSDMSKDKKEYDTLSDKYDVLKKDYSNLKTEYDEYKTKMKPFEELDEKEAEARKIEAQKKIEEEEAKKKKQEEEEAKKKEEEEKKGYNTGITYKQLARTPDDYIGKKIKFKGKVLQVVDGTDEVHIRLAVNGSYDTVLYCAYDPSLLSFRILEDDQITVYGTSYGIYSYTATSGATISIPSAWLDKIELKE